MLDATCTKDTSPTTGMVHGPNTSAHKSGPLPSFAQQPSQTAALSVTDEMSLSAVKVESVGGRAKTPEHAAGLEPKEKVQNAPTVRRERPVGQSGQTIKTGIQGVQRHTVVPSQVKGIHNGWKKRKRPLASTAG